jgi:alpha-1,3/alpha-1,6-mannosyltransferase
LLVQRVTPVKRLYRVPFDLLEETTTALSDHILVNSNFTRGVFLSTFHWIRRILGIEPSVLYPCIELGPEDAVSPRKPDGKVVFLSINRYERKKAVHLALEALKVVRDAVSAEKFDTVELVIAGGYDTRVQENVEVYEDLVAKAEVGSCRSRFLVPVITSIRTV